MDSDFSFNTVTSLTLQMIKLWDINWPFFAQYKNTFLHHPELGLYVHSKVQNNDKTIETKTDIETQLQRLSI